jgi:hypothetical protein
MTGRLRRRIEKPPHLLANVRDRNWFGDIAIETGSEHSLAISVHNKSRNCQNAARDRGLETPDRSQNLKAI